jgi:hypothetical protein
VSVSTVVPAEFAGENVSDAAKRIKDEADMHALAGAHGYFVVALADGRPLDHTAYETWADAVRAAKHDRDRHLFLEIQPDGMPSAREAEAVLQWARFCHDQGWRIPSPDWDGGPLASSMPHQPRDRHLMARQLVAGKPLLPEGFAMSNLPSERPQPVRRQFRKVRKHG